MELRHFKYVARNADGRTVKGRIEALDRQVCTKFLHSKNYDEIRITEYKNIFGKLSGITIGKLLPTTQLIFFLKQLGSLLKAGVNILPAVELLSLQQDKHRLRMLYFEIYQHLYNGLSLSKALAMRPKEFPNLLVLMIEVGELSGKLPQTVLDMAAYYEKQTKINTQIKGALRMPIVYMAATILIAIGMIMFVFPTITDLFASFEGAEMPGITLFFLAIGDFMSAYALYLLGGLFLIVATLVTLDRKNPRFHKALSVFLLKMPIAGPLIRMSNQILIANSLAQMLESGINSVQALQTVRTVLANVVYKDLLSKTLAYVDDGFPFSKAFEESEFIDPIMGKMIATGENTGDVPGLMKNLSVYYNGVSELRVEQIKNAIQPILLLFVYAMVAVMILALMLPMLSLGSQI